MAQDYSEYLAVHVLNEQQLVSYRSLSRALKLHSNLAKQSVVYQEKFRAHWPAV